MIIQFKRWLQLSRKQSVGFDISKLELKLYDWEMVAEARMIEKFHEKKQFYEAISNRGLN